MPAFISDWTFWSFVVAATAVGLSQAPPIRLWFKKPRLDLEIQSSIYLSHLIGIQLFQVFVSLINTGGRTVRVRDIRLVVARTGQEPTTLPISGVFLKPEAARSVLFVPFTLRAADEWMHNCHVGTSNTLPDRPSDPTPLPFRSLLHRQYLLLWCYSLGVATTD